MENKPDLENIIGIARKISLMPEYALEGLKLTYGGIQNASLWGAVGGIVGGAAGYYIDKSKNKKNEK